MCDHIFPFPFCNSFYHQYMVQHAALSYQFQKLHNFHNGPPIFGMHSMHNPAFHNPPNIYNQTVDPTYMFNQRRCDLSYSSSSSSCSSGSSSDSASEYEEQYENDDYDEDGSDFELEFNADCILAMRAAKEEIRRQELAEEAASKSKDGESDSKDKESDSQDETESSESSLIVVDSDDIDSDDSIDPSISNILSIKPFRNLGGLNKGAEADNRKAFMKHMYGSQSNVVTALETTMNLTFSAFTDDLQPTLWPVLPLRL